MLRSEMKYVGVDWCVGGWLSVGLDNGDGYEVKGFMEFADLVAYFSDACLILVDMPIGLNPDTQQPIRPCDTQARTILNRLGGESGSVFPAPNRRLAGEAMRGGVKWLNHGVNWARTENPVRCDWSAAVNSQTFSIASATGEVYDVLNNPGTGNCPTIREIHPEVCFRLLGVERKIRHKKTTLEGICQRKKVLRGYEPLTDNIFENASAKFRNKGAAGDDDILDALVAAVTAKLGCQNVEYELHRLPGREPTTCDNAPPDGMEMLYVVMRQ
jgi:predicted RNase H-like nuclease